jgi:hypothetical protein
MADLQIKPPDEPEEESLFGTIFLRVGATFLCLILGLLFILFGYMIAIYKDLDLEEFNAYPSVYFSVTTLLWILIGIFTPFTLFQRVFEELKGMSFVRVIAFILIVGALIILHWYLITIMTYLLVSIFGAE